MSKYQKLDSAEAPTAHDDDYDESFSLYFDDNRPNKEQHHDNSSHIRLNTVGANRGSHMTNGNPKYQHHQSPQNNNNNSHSLNPPVATVLQDLDLEHTWEVPLLGRSEEDGNEHQHSENEQNQARQMHMNMESGIGCRSFQPGFGVNLKSKSSQEAKLKILLAISLCCIFMIIEFLGGYKAGSLAIMTDAAHLASDCISFVIGLVAIWLGGRPPDARMSFGYKRFEVLGALASILGIWLLTAMLVVVAIERIYTQEFELDANVMMCISGIGIAINVIMVFVLHGSWFMGGTGHGHSHTHGHGHSHSPAHSYTDLAAGEVDSSLTATTISNAHHDSKPIKQNGHPERNLNLRAAMIHVIGDLVQSIGVFLAAVLIKFCPGAKYADPLCTLLFSVIVIMTTVQLFRESMSILLDAVPSHVCVAALERELAHLEGVKSVHHLNVWQHTNEHSVLMVHLVIDAQSPSQGILKKATTLACGSQFNIKHATIQIER